MPPRDEIEKLLMDLPEALHSEVLRFIQRLKAEQGAPTEECRDGSNPPTYDPIRVIEHGGSYERVAGEVLSLPADLRLSLIERLLASLNLPIQTEIDGLWREEAERRVAQVSNAEVRLIPGEEVFRKIGLRGNHLTPQPLP